ncbi:MAG: hypothetical protein H6970_12780 [Gammaproteobacteria bacterium]|nr:hypothetical protein [Gammaproteobacteria bacterium]
MKWLTTQALPCTPADVYIKISATSVSFRRLIHTDVLDELLNALGKTGPVYTTVHHDKLRHDLEMDGIRCQVEASDHWSDPSQPALDVRIETMPGVVGVFNKAVEVALRNLLDRLDLGAEALQSYQVASCQPINMDAMRVRYGDNPSLWPACTQPVPVWILRKRRVFMQIRVLEPFEVDGSSGPYER